METAPVRRADFLMALAYATDLATGHSRDFALRSCVLGCGSPSARRSTSRRAEPSTTRRLPSLHRVQRRQAPAGRGLGRRDRAPPGPASHRHRQQGGVQGGLRPGHHAHLRGGVARGARPGAPTRPRRGRSGERPRAVGTLRGRAADRRANRPARGDPREPRPDLRALGRTRPAAWPVGPRSEVSGPPRDAGAGRNSRSPISTASTR